MRVPQLVLFALLFVYMFFLTTYIFKTQEGSLRENV